ncbi:V-type proton ATPase subunit G-like [Physella acuta]|uniref:V-type proton ATPase subunit G-like n=1 Tax=Physella acuta TaxID=109671 RepID=UPI0027DC4B32|nr:V-type proton ATPase subunit G-like [Physella acuta]
MYSREEKKSSIHRLIGYILHEREPLFSHKQLYLNYKVKTAQKTEGIQQLLIAEKKATERVVEARKRKAQRIKTAKKEADSEILAFKNEKGNHYKQYEQEILGKKSNSGAQIQVETTKKFKELDVMLKQNCAKAMDAIQQSLIRIEVQLHENVKL